MPERTLSAYAFNVYGDDAKLYNGIHDLETALDAATRRAEKATAYAGELEGVLRELKAEYESTGMLDNARRVTYIWSLTRIGYALALTPPAALEQQRERIRREVAMECLSEWDTLARWIRAGNYSRDDARDEIARAVENHSRQLRLHFGLTEQPTTHHYISTACQHGLHDQCRRQCKFCDEQCACTCGHQAVQEQR